MKFSMEDKICGCQSMNKNVPCSLNHSYNNILYLMFDYLFSFCPVSVVKFVFLCKLHSIFAIITSFSPEVQS